MSDAKELIERLKQKIKDMKPLIPKNAAKAVAEKMDGRFSQSYVYDILNGRKFNLEIAEELLKLAKENELRAIKLEKNIDKLLEKNQKK